jgi:hypothetical protein
LIAARLRLRLLLELDREALVDSSRELQGARP